MDGVGAFVGPGRVLLHMVRDPQHPDFENLSENRRRLETTDARGRERCEARTLEFDDAQAGRVSGIRTGVPFRSVR